MKIFDLKGCGKKDSSLKRRRAAKGRSLRITALLMAVVVFTFSGCAVNVDYQPSSGKVTYSSDILDSGTQDKSVGAMGSAAGGTLTEADIPEYSGDAYIAVNDNQPNFTEADKTTQSFETYSELDSLGRCGMAYANVGQDLMPTEKRGSIGQVKPTGWHTVKYDFVNGKYLYNRCHLIGYQLTAENANKQNLITGTRYLNIDGMLPFENMVADYVKETGNHVLYRVTPIFDGEDLLAEGVQMEGFSVEDSGDGVCFNVFAYNVQPDVTIDYSTGESWAA